MSSQPPIWYISFAAIPRIVYRPPITIERTRLAGHNVTPSVHYYNFEGRKEAYLLWPLRSGSTSASPAAEWMAKEIKPKRQETLAEALRRQCHEALELPGTVSDYHFAIQGTHDQLWKHRHAEPWVLEEIERLCLLDIDLVEAYPEAVRFDESDPGRYARVVAFNRLIGLYEREGYIYEALEVAQRAQMLNQAGQHMERLKQKIQALEEEDE